MDFDDDVLQMFVEEAEEHLDGIEGDLLGIENTEDNLDEDLVNKIFRAIHSVKGGSSFFALNRVKQLAHVMETLLDMIRNRKRAPSSPVINILLSGADMLRSMVADYEHSEEVDISEIHDTIQQFIDGDTPNTVTEDHPSDPALLQLDDLAVIEPADEELEPLLDTTQIFDQEGHAIFDIADEELARAAEEVKGGRYTYLIRFDLAADSRTHVELKVEMEDLGILLQDLIIPQVEAAQWNGPFARPYYGLLSSKIELDMMKTLLQLTELQILQVRGPEPASAPTTSVAHRPESRPARREEQSAPPAVTTTAVARSTDSTAPKRKKPEGSIRVSLPLLDRLMTLAGELVLTRNQLMLSAQSRDMTVITKACQGVDSITSELQEAIMSTRMQSLGIIFHKFNRVVRDLSHKLGKEIELVLDGEDVELDKTIIESIGDPLTHLVRNSVDHGIESPDERLRKGKPATGTLRLSAYHEAGQVMIQIIDDGGGVHPGKVRAKAISSGLLTDEDAAVMLDEDVIKLIFQPGFSTAETVSDVSGRGVGMDVVNANLTAIGGVIDLSSEVDVGTTITIKLPLTLAIIPSLLVEVEQERFALPQVNLIELFRMNTQEMTEQIECVGNAYVTRLRGYLLPLIHLRDVLGLPHPPQADHTETDREIESFRHLVGSARTIYVAVIDAGSMRYGLIVEHLLDSAEIVVKPLGKHLKECGIYAGATILGDGGVALILDAVGIRDAMELSGKVMEERTALTNETAEVNFGNRQTLLLVHNSGKERFALPLALILRIEKIRHETIEDVGGRRAIQHRGHSLTLFEISEVANVKPIGEQATYNVIIFKVAEREVGILFSSVLDVVDVDVEIDDVTYRQPGIYGSAIIDGHITLMVDMYDLVKRQMPNLVETPQLPASTSQELPATFTVLVVEDSRFFMNQICSFLEEQGFLTVSAVNGREGLQMLGEHPEIDLIITDIEMPEMNGVDMVRKIREQDAYEAVPIMAVTSVAGDAAEAKGRDVGMDEYLIKLDREIILERCMYYRMNGRNVV